MSHSKSRIPVKDTRAGADRVLSANARVVLALKDAILNGTYPIGSLLPPEDDLLRLLDVSRVSLREGIKQLEVLGWLFIERGNGTRVVEPGFTVMESTIDFLARFELIHFSDFHQLRRLIEVETAADLARQCPRGLIASLRTANAEIKAEHAQPSGYVDADVRFHDLLIEHSPNPLFPRLLAGCRKYLQLSRRLSFSGPAAVLETVKAHERIIASIERADPETARTAMADHLTVTAEQLRRR